MTTMSLASPISVSTIDHAEARPRKVLHFIAGIGGGGAENFMRSLIAAMRDTHWQPVVLAVCVHPHEAFAEQLRGLGCVVHDLNETALLKPRVWLAVRRIIAQERPDVVQTWMHHPDFIGSVAAFAAGIHNIVWGVRATEVHRNPGDSNLKVRLFHLALRWGSKLLPRKIIANSTMAIDVHAGMGYPRNKMVWIPNGVNATRFMPDAQAGHQTRAALGIPPEAPVIGFVGRFHPVKDLACFFRATVRLQVIQPDAHFVLVGGEESDLDAEAQSAFVQLSQPAHVHWVPFGSSTERFYPAFSVFTLCSKSEAFPNVVLEAMACGVPCVTTRAGDCATMLKDLGIVVATGDDKALAEGWHTMLALSANQRESLSTRSRERAVQDYSMERAARQFAATYDSLMTSR